MVQNFKGVFDTFVDTNHFLPGKPVLFFLFGNQGYEGEADQYGANEKVNSKHIIKMGGMLVDL